MADDKTPRLSDDPSFALQHGDARSLERGRGVGTTFDLPERTRERTEFTLPPPPGAAVIAPDAPLNVVLTDPAGFPGLALLLDRQGRQVRPHEAFDPAAEGAWIGGLGHPRDALLAEALALVLDQAERPGPMDLLDGLAGLLDPAPDLNAAVYQLSGTDPDTTDPQTALDGALAALDGPFALVAVREAPAASVLALAGALGVDTVPVPPPPPPLDGLPERALPRALLARLDAAIAADLALYDACRLRLEAAGRPPSPDLRAFQDRLLYDQHFRAAQDKREQDAAFAARGELIGKLMAMVEALKARR